MATNDKYVNLELKRFLSYNRMKDNFLDYLRNENLDYASRIFPDQGLFTYPVALTYVAGVLAITTDPTEGTDGEGHILSETGAGLTLPAVPDTGGKDYWFAMHYCEVPNGVNQNPRTGLPEYDLWEEELGVTGTPTSVSAGVGTITLNVNSITQSGVDYSGFEVQVWLNNPQDPDAAVAIETCTIAYGAPNNTITTTGDLGQATISTTAADYTVRFVGIYWKEVATGAGNPFTSDYCILGFGVGGGVANTNDQVDLSGGGGHSLQNAYTGSGAGAGRDIDVEYQAVELRQANGGTMLSKDIANSSLRLVKDEDGTIFADTAKDYENCIDIKGRAQSFSGVMYRALLVDETGTGELQKDETVSIAIGTANVTFTRATPPRDLTLPAGNANIEANYDLVEIEGTTADDGVYLIASVAAGLLTVTHMDGSAVSFSQNDTGTASIYRPLARLAGGDGYMSAGLNIVTLGDFYKDYSGAYQQKGGLYILAPSGCDDADELITTYKSASKYFKVKADGRIQCTETIATLNGDITATNGDISAAAGSVSAGTTVAATTTVTGGTGVIATTGGVTATAGNITAVANDIVCTAGDIQVTNNTKNFKWGTARQFYRSYNALDYSILSSETYTLVVSSGYPVMNLTSYAASASRPVDFGYVNLKDIPQGATVIGIELLINTSSSSAVNYPKIYFEFRDQIDDWIAGPYGTSSSVLATSNQTASKALLRIATGVISVAIDYNTRSYYLALIDNGDGTANESSVNTSFRGVRVTYTLLNLLP